MSTVKMVRGKTARVREEQGNGGGAPNLYTPEQLKRWNADVEANNGDWVPNRPLGWQGLFSIYGLKRRIKLAWGVFTGRYDALKWPI
jgi:hypothetical protein